MPDVTVGPFNTIAITAASGVYRLREAGGMSHPIDLLNIGPGSVFLRADLDPVVNDPNSLLLPANTGFNHLMVDGSLGLGIIATADTTISVKVR